MDEIADAIYSRWTDASLNASIGQLRAVGNERRSSNTGAPGGTAVPRAGYHVSMGPVLSKSRNSRIRQALVTIKVWDDSKADVDGYIASIHDAFVNSEAAGTNPFALATGNSMDVDDGGSFVFTEDDEVYIGQQTLTVLHSIQNSTPA